MKYTFFFLFFFSLFAFSQTSFEKGEKLWMQKKSNEAKQVFQDYLKSHPNHAKSLEYLGDIAGSQKQWDQALEYYKKLKNSYPKDANYCFKYGGALGMKAKESNKFKALGMLDDVENAFLTAAKLDAKHLESRWALVVLYLELPSIIGGSENKAQKYADELQRISNAQGYLAKGYIDSHFKRYGKAELQYRKAFEIDPSKIIFEKLYDLYLNKLKDRVKASKLKTEFERK
jgi:tetratricopeptide (TPR) repeat protein